MKFSCICVYLCVGFWSGSVLAAVREIQLPPRLMQCLKRYNKTGGDVTKEKPSYFHFCLELFFLETGPERWSGWNVSDSATWAYSLFTESLIELANRSRTSTRRVRKEYRLLSVKERDDFHRAVNLLKNDTSLWPNKYDALAGLHTGRASSAAHGGESFLVWHQFYIYIFETALREKVPTVTIPFWDFTLDSFLPDPRQSYLWTDELMGNGDGIVKNGPFAYWHTPAGPLNRKTGAQGGLPSKAVIDSILSKTKLSEISYPVKDFEHNFELQHGMVHEWVGGHISVLDSAPMDPVFLILHSFVDYIWYKFRKHQHALGIFTQTEFTTKDVNSQLSFYNTLGIVPLSVNLALLLSDSYRSYLYKYEPLPDCSQSKTAFKSRYLECFRGQYIAKAVKSPATKSNMPSPFQNDFCIDGDCDIDHWEYIPVQVLYKRSVRNKNYKSCPIYNGKIRETVDIYHPMYNNINIITKNWGPFVHTARSCLDAEFKNHLTPVFLRSSGLNYQGVYKEYAIVDRRLALSGSVSYLGVKSPRQRPSRVLMEATDSLGRLCEVSCLIPGSQPPKYQRCFGAIEINNKTSELPCPSLKKAYEAVWRLNQQEFFQYYKQDNIAVVFYCNPDNRM